MSDFQKPSLNTLARDPRYRAIFLFGMASGLPSSLVFATLSIWLREESVSRTEIGLIGVAATPYAINFLWAPLVDHGRLGWLSARLGRRRSWIMLCQLALVPGVITLGLQTPQNNALMFGICALIVSFLSATQDVAIDAYRVEILRPNEYGTGAAIAIYGWHTGAFITGAGALYVAAFGGWAVAYVFGGCVIGAGVIFTLLAREPERPSARPIYLSGTGRWLREAALAPLAEFFSRLRWLALLVIAVIVFYKFGDAMLGRMAGVFYVDVGYTKLDIANYSKTVGLMATLLGVGLGGWACVRLGIMRAMVLGALLMMLTNFSFALLASSGKNFELLAVVVFFDNLTGGMATTAFVAYLSSLCNLAFTATQYALLASLGNFARIQLGATSGWMIDLLAGDWTLFFIAVGTMSIPAIALLLWLIREMPEIKQRH